MPEWLGRRPFRTRPPFCRRGDRVKPRDFINLVGGAAGGWRPPVGARPPAGLGWVAAVAPGPEGNPSYPRRKGARSAWDFVRLVAPQRRHGDVSGRGERAGGDR